MKFIIITLLITLAYSQAPNCKTSISSTQCLECNDGFFLVIEETASGIPNLVCQAVSDIAHCAQYDGNACVKCDETYYLENNQCNPCNIANCLYCSKIDGENICIQCGKSGETQLYLSADEKSCVDCSDESNDEICGRCGTGKYFDISSKKCENCMENCELCTESYNCFQCGGKTLLERAETASTSTPDKCTPLEHCVTEYTMNDHCELCVDGYTLQKGKCVKCPDNCNTCYFTDYSLSSPDKCTTCAENYMPKNGQCIEKSTVHCAVASPTYGCLECEAGYYFDENLDCQKCDSKCGNCVNTADHCLSCAEGHFFVTDADGKTTCKPKDEHCNLADQAGCKECINDLTQTNVPGWYVPEGKTDCEQCNEFCKLCSGKANDCSACIDNYTLVYIVDTPANSATGQEEEGHYECEKMKETCLKAEMGYCTQCAEGYFIGSSSGNGTESTQECINCDKSCGTCMKSDECISCAAGYYKKKDGPEEDRKLCKPQSDIDMTCNATTSGCETCFDGYYMNPDDDTATNCTACDPQCTKCVYNKELKKAICTACKHETTEGDMYAYEDGTCHKCSELPNCLKCVDGRCETCVDGYTMDGGNMSCSKTNLAAIIPSVVAGVVVLIIIFIIIVAIIWWRRSKSVKAETAAIKPFHVSSDLELILLGADNDKFPLKTDKWDLTFGLQKAKAIVDQEYEEVVQLANMSKKEYYYEFHFTPSHKYGLDIEPKSATLKPGTAINVTFKIKMLCTASVQDNIGISAMDVDDQNKETAKFTIVIESDLSLKLDHTELKPIMPPIGEGAFGMVFRGTYRGREVAIKKMKSRNLTQEQEKEFNHEVSMMTQLRHNCVVELIGAVYTEGEISIVTEFAEYSSLSKIWGKQTVGYELKVKILDDMVVALAYLHQNSILHRDVKGENLLVFSLNPHSPVCAKLTDFGTCRNISERNLSAKALSTGIGTPTYMSPECLQNSTNYSYPVDVYAFGIVLYETYIERNAYDDDERFNQPWMIPQFVIEGNRLEQPEGIPENYWDLTTRCWQQDPENRPTFAQILSEIEGWGLDIKYALMVDGEKKAAPAPAQEEAEEVEENEGSDSSQEEE